MGNWVSKNSEENSENSTNENQQIISSQPKRSRRLGISTYSNESAVDVEPKTKIYLSDSCNCDNCTCCLFCPSIEPQQLQQ